MTKNRRFPARLVITNLPIKKGGLRLLLLSLSLGYLGSLFGFLGSLDASLNLLLLLPRGGNLVGVKRGRNLGRLVSLGLDRDLSPNLLTVNLLKDGERGVRKLNSLILLKDRHQRGNGHLTSGGLDLISVHRHIVSLSGFRAFSLASVDIIAEIQRIVKLRFCELSCLPVLTSLPLEHLYYSRNSAHSQALYKNLTFAGRATINFILSSYPARFVNSRLIIPLSA